MLSRTSWDAGPIFISLPRNAILGEMGGVWEGGGEGRGGEGEIEEKNIYISVVCVFFYAVLLKCGIFG